MRSERSSLSPAAARALLGLAAFGLAGCLLFGVAWWRAARSSRGLDALAPHERQALLEETLEVSPGIYVPAWFEPRLGYTLVPGREIEAWGTTVAANELGYRSPPVAKAPGVLRVLFLGDSWTFGMGVEAEEAFPARLAALADRHAGPSDPVEAWSLALPGYNLLNQLTGLTFFGDRLEPDAVVVCPTPNDADSTSAVLPNGSLGATGLAPADFGEPLYLAFPSPFIESFTLRQRWREGFRRLREAERRLAERGVPLLVFFTGLWEPAMAHRLVAEAGLDGPYVLAPPRLTVGRWRNPPPVQHPTPEAHALYARMVYKGLAPLLGWAEAPELPPGAPAEADAPVHRRGSARGQGRGQLPDWQQEAARVARQRAEARIPTRFRPGEEARSQVAGLMDHRTGLVSRGALVHVRRPAGADRLRVTVGKIDSASLYPLDVILEIPSPSGGTERSVTLPAGDGGPLAFEVPLPEDLPEGGVVDLVVRPERAVAFPDSLGARSLTLLEVEPVGGSGVDSGGG